MPKQRRQHERVKRRLRVHFGEDDLEQTGMATDISIGGIFLKARRIFDIGTYLHMHVVDDELDFYTESRVVRIRRVDPRLRRIEKEGMGIRFVSAAEIIKNRVPRTSRTIETNVLVCESVADVEKVLREQLSAGVVMVPTSEALDLQTMVEFQIRCEVGPNTTTLDGVGRVIQILNTQDSPNAVLEVQNVAELRGALEASIAQP